MKNKKSLAYKHVGTSTTRVVPFESHHIVHTSFIAFEDGFRMSLNERIQQIDQD